MTPIETTIKGLILIQPNIIFDDRGYFYESYQKRRFEEFGIIADFVQDNESMSNKGVLRGLHFQNPPYEMGKLVKVTKGSVLDVAVDLRKGSDTYGKWYKAFLSSTNKTMFWIPAGFAHGFVTMEDNTIFQYKCTNYYNKESEVCIVWNDPVLDIDWGIWNPIVSEKDSKGILFKDFKSLF